jgi:hypothetical protein
VNVNIATRIELSALFRAAMIRFSTPSVGANATSTALPATVALCGVLSALALWNFPPHPNTPPANTTTRSRPLAISTAASLACAFTILIAFAQGSFNQDYSSMSYA